MFFQTSLVWGSLIASFALGIGRNQTEAISQSTNNQCGVNFCQPASAMAKEDSNNTVTSVSVDENFKTTDTQIYVLAGIYLGCSLLGPILIAVFVDPISRLVDITDDVKDAGEDSKANCCELLVATGRQMRKWKQMLLIPLTVWSGLEQGFFGADFTAGFVTCAFGVDKVGYVIVTYGICDSACSLGLSLLIKKFGRVPLFLMAAFINLAVILVLRLWIPNPSEFYVLFVIAALWGISDAIWQTQINTLYGVLFTGEETTGGFSNYRLWESAGFILAYILQSHVCIYSKLWVLIVMLGLGMIGYLTVEWGEEAKNTNNNTRQQE